MRAFVYKGEEYRSLAECCKKLKISYQKVRRLCRHYTRASRDPAFAVAWCTGEMRLSALEPKTFKYAQDLELGAIRRERWLEKNEKSLLEKI